MIACVRGLCVCVSVFLAAEDSQKTEGQEQENDTPNSLRSPKCLFRVRTNGTDLSTVLVDGQIPTSIKEIFRGP
jgi:hypothetical protein